MVSRWLCIWRDVESLLEKLPFLERKVLNLEGSKAGGRMYNEILENASSRRHVALRYG